MRISVLLFLSMVVAWSCGSDSKQEAPDTGLDVVSEVQVDSQPELAADLEPEELPPVEDIEDVAPEIEDVVEVEELVPEVVEVVEEVDTLTWDYPDPAIVNKMEAQPLVSAASTFVADETVQYRCPDHLPGTAARAVKWVSGTLWVGTDAGLFKYLPETDAFELVPITENKSIVDIAGNMSTNGLFFVAATDAIIWFQPAGALTGTLPLPDDAVEFTSVAVQGTDVVAGTKGLGLIRVILNTPADYLPAGSAGGPLAPAVRDVAYGPSGTIWVATSEGILVLAGDEISRKNAANGDLPDDDVRALFVDSANFIWAITPTSVVRIKGAETKILTAGVGMLPTEAHLSIAVGQEMLVLGHEVGATVVEEPLKGDLLFKRFDHYHSKRFLPGNSVYAVAIDGDGNVWMATSGGVAKRQLLQMTYEEKEAFFHEMLERQFWRMDGFVSSDAILEHPDQYYQDVDWLRWDKDNDGLWTQMQIGAFCYAYAVTKDEKYYEAARKAMKNMFMLVDLPAVTFGKRGFIARSIVRDDEGEVFNTKMERDNWHEVEWEGKTYYWKDDTSSDEIDGHFYGFPLYYDLCAKTEEEKQEVAKYASEVLDYILDNGYLLIDLDGEKTTHGHWGPDTIGSAGIGLNECMAAAKGKPNMVDLVAWCVDSYYGGGWLNGNEIVGALLATYHMTGDKKYYDAYEILIQVHGYDNLLVPHQDTLTVTNPSIMNHSDHELAMLAYQTVLRYEPNPERRQKWIDGFKFFYDYEVVERNPLWAAYAALAMETDPNQVAETLVSLQEIPRDLREWAIDQSHRKDSLPWPLDRFDKPQTENVYPYDEIRTIWWNGNLHVVTSGGDGRNVNGPLAWLLPYWAFRYAGIISE